MASFSAILRRSIPKPAFRWSILLFLLLGLQPGRAATDNGPNLGPIFDRFGLTLSPGERTEVAGPLWYHERKETQETWAIPPLMSYSRDPATELKEFDFAYPVLTYDRYGEQYRWQLFQLLSFSGGRTQTETHRDRFTLFPLYFQQRSSDPKENYRGVIPFYGHVQKHFFRDETSWVMWPFFVETRRGEIITDNYLAPFFHLRHGPGLTGWQLWPLIGKEHKDVTTRTSQFYDPEMVPGHDKFFALWPIYYNEHAGLGTTNPDWNLGVLPFYAFERSPLRDSTTVLWPFFSRVHDREKKYNEWDLPWPFIVFARGEGKYVNRVFPLYSHAKSPTLEDDFYLWPLYKVDKIHSPPLERRRRRVAFFLFSDITEHSTETGHSRRRTDLWPLFTRRRDLNGDRRLQVFAPLEVWTMGSHKIEGDYSPVWSVWRSERKAQTGANSQSLLWNLYRRDASPERTKVSALFGLFQYQKADRAKQVRIFYIPFGKRSSQPGTSTPASQRAAEENGG